MPLPPTFVFLQSCLALTEFKVHPLLSRGAFGVIGSSTRTYSGSGGACSLAFFNALLYEEQSVGDCAAAGQEFPARLLAAQAKATGKDATRHRGQRPRGLGLHALGRSDLETAPPTQSTIEPPSRCLPSAMRYKATHPRVAARPEAKTRCGRISIRSPCRPTADSPGWCAKSKIEERRPLVPFVFAEIHLPQGGAGIDAASDEPAAVQPLGFLLGRTASLRLLARHAAPPGHRGIAIPRPLGGSGSQPRCPRDRRRRAVIFTPERGAWP